MHGRAGKRIKRREQMEMVPTTGLEPINMVFSPLLKLASFGVFITHRVTRIANVFKYNMAFTGNGGKKTVCKLCARKVTVQVLCKCNSTWNLCKSVQRFWPVFG